MEWWWDAWSIWHSPYGMVVECIVHMTQSIWNGGGMDGPYSTVHMEWWWNAWSIWHSPHGMVVECMVYMAQSTWNGDGMYGPYGTVHMEWWWNPYGIHGHYRIRKWLEPQPIVIPYGLHGMADGVHGVHMHSIRNNPERVKTSEIPKIFGYVSM